MDALFSWDKEWSVDGMADSDEHSYSLTVLQSYSPAAGEAGIVRVLH